MIPKFRFFDKGYKVWLHPDQVWLDETGAFRGVDGVTRFEPVGGDLVVMQSTGLFDKSGVEIFEGDVVAYFDDNEQASENVTIRYGKHIDEASVFKEKPRHIGFYIEATKGTATFDVINMYEEFKENIKVIGNIHEHPELVEVRR